MKIKLASLVGAVICVAPAFTQYPGPAPVIQTYREVVKQGKNTTHDKVEMDYVRAFRKAKHPGYYLGFTSVSGPNEAWFISP